ncbi:selenocysteine-specific translation elongation factor [Vespertiliibacter pulmonis]|uniref:Selenocysteine-specific elongation factor n=1 Tax=Vespertiliibacter pulmonis TaxID=1443036 RepID=A0A3N4VPH7_9PAST|nr:selenocysteine-specific translation elongation factor [Vespertiliibacter pulmonis]QLB20823.1 selenocysteine-specific translation elongation factor [Vespertiliibacter pulmonis]RPE83473.1 selenocysteine-specific translation elongation factor SelB [Vespertiliibacter pulmonis]
MIIVTAGHVDHGKTSLLHALTGTHTAHLPEEKKRGLTIDLGYAYLPLGESVIGFIDVPGHQKFLSNMLAGLGGVKYALLVVSAEEGIKPQTEEHLAILHLLSFEQIIVVLTKADRVEQERIVQLSAELRQRYPFLTNSPFFVTSAQTKQGIDELKTYLASLAEDPVTNRPFRYTIDRIFTVKGAGVVVTGTAIAGKVGLGDEFYFTNNKKVRVKNIHAQNQPATFGYQGQRLALNIANVEKEDIQRGDWITQCEAELSDRISVQLSPAQLLKESNIVHIYHYASHVTGKLNLLNVKQAAGLGNYFAELIFDQPLPCVVGDKLIIRNGDDSQTLAGAKVIEINSPKRHKRQAVRLAYLAEIAQADNQAARIDCYVRKQAVNIPHLLWCEQIFRADLEQLAREQGYFIVDQWLFDLPYKQYIQQQIELKLADYHQQYSDQLGVTKARLYRIATLGQPIPLVYTLIDELIAQGKLMQTRGWIHSPDHRIAFSGKEMQLWAEIQPLFAKTHQALWVRDIAKTLFIDENEMRNLLYKAGKLGYLVPIVKDRFLLHEQVSEFAQKIKQIILQQGDISVNQLRDEIQYGRKLTVQLIEYFDRSGFLRRKGDVHLLRDVDTY